MSLHWFNIQNIMTSTWSSLNFQFQIPLSGFSWCSLHSCASTRGSEFKTFTWDTLKNTSQNEKKTEFSQIHPHYAEPPRSFWPDQCHRNHRNSGKNNMAKEKSTMNVRCNFLLGKGGFPASLVSFTGGTNSHSRVSSHVFFSRWDEKFRRHFATESTPQTVEWWTSRGNFDTPQVGMLHMGDPRWSFFVVFGRRFFFWLAVFSNKNIGQVQRKSQVIFINWPGSI